MIYYQVLKDNKEQGFISLSDFRFYHPRRERMFMTSSLKEAQYIIFDGEYYKVSWLEEAKEIKGKYPEVELILASQKEYEKYIAEQEEAKSNEK